MSQQVRVELPDGSVKEVPAGTTVEDFISEQIGPGLAKAALGARLDGRQVDLARPIEEDGRLTVVTSRDEEGQKMLRHSSAHILASAVKRLFPEAKLDDGPATETGFFYDIAYERPFTPEDLEKIEAEANRIIKEGHRFERRVASRKEALAWAREHGERFKIPIIEKLPDDAEISFYRHGEFEDLCRGPHIPSVSKVGAFKVLSVAGAYWGGDERNEMLQRIYGTAFTDKKELKAFLHRLEEAKRRDHRKLGKELDLFSVDPHVGGGLILWHPKGSLVRKMIEDFWRDTHLAAGYDLVYSPHVGRAELWQTSGHLDFYRESMYPEMELEGQSYFAKPMNCPFHMTIYKSHMRSYRELPMKLGELGTVYRFERSGTLHGLMRVRGFTQDDAHLFIRPDQLEAQVVEVVGFCLDMLRTFGFTEFEAYVSTRPEKAVGTPEQWDTATAALNVAAKKAGLDARIDEGGGAFYGPKIDLKLKDAIGRTWQCSTVQFDFNLPERFDLKFVGDDNAPHTPYVIHRALLGSIERFFGVLVEHYAGAFPMWLAPVQIGIVTIADRHLDHAHALAADLRAQGLRVSVDETSEKMGAKIRRYALQKLPYVLVVGDKEVEADGASVRKRGGGDEGFASRAALLERFSAEARRPRLGEPPPDAEAAATA
jgi:threonyl-tRNA synthetase